MPFVEFLETFTRQSLFLFILLLEVFGTIIILFSANSVFLFFLRTNRDVQKIRLTLAGHLALGLEFFLAAETLRTVVARSWRELQILAAIIVIRSIFALLIHWEIKQNQTRS